MSSVNLIPNYPTPLVSKGSTTKDWYFFFVGLWKGIPPENETGIVLGASPYVYSAPKKGSVILSGAGTTLVEFSRDGTTWYTTGVTQGMFPVNAADLLRITYGAAPTATFVPT